jgi:geranylgeranyl pyrophosphate synthase
LNQVIYPIKEELKNVQDSMNRYFYIKAGYLGDFAHLDICRLDNILRPALVTLSAGIFGKITHRVISLAAVLQYIFLASCIHQGVNEDDEIIKAATGDTRDDCQFPVLVGDYFFGRFFTTLCDADIVDYLGPLAEIICVINEGGVMRLRNADSAGINPLLLRELVRKETAEMLSGCCRLGARLNGANGAQQEILGRTGINIGMVLGLVEQGNSFEQAAVCLREDLPELDKLPPGPCRMALKELVELLLRRDVPLERLVG